ncbi:hypothetical protein [Streptomyces massasporeus]|uniref:hypothetical protein n=1 Tax=Streptomyces massasporeus TaxID=67324 RepID=UPI0033E2837C
MRDETFTESDRDESDKLLDQLLTAAHDELIDSIEAEQNASITRFHARAARTRKTTSSHLAENQPATLPAWTPDDDPTLPAPVPHDALAEWQLEQTFRHIGAHDVISPALEEALRTLEDLQAALREAANSREMSALFRHRASQSIHLNARLMQLLIQRNATLHMAEEFFAAIMSMLASEAIWDANRRQYRNLVARLRASHDAVTYLFEDCDSRDPVLV